MPRAFEPMRVAEARYCRFSESRTAFNAVSRDMGENWQVRFGRRRQRLVAEGKAAPKMPFDDPSDGLFHYAYSEAFDRVNVLTASWGSGKSNRNALLWEPTPTLPEELLARRVGDSVRLRREVERVARHCGAVGVGVAPLSPRWVYADVQRNHCSPDAPVRQPIRFTDDPRPSETDEALWLPKSMGQVIVMTVPMDRDMILTAPSLLSEAATSLGYSDAARAAVSVAEFIRSLGYQAIPSLNGTALSIPLAVEAGLGQVGRNGLLITPERGACVRLCKVFTDMPLHHNSPVDYGIVDFCRVCGACAEHCPSQAITHGEPTIDGHNECNYAGIEKWHVNAKRCLRYWVSSGTSCSACIAHCPFTYGTRWFGGLPQWALAYLPGVAKHAWFAGTLARLTRRTSARRRASSSEYLS